MTERYDKYIVAFSGGKDSMACFLHLLDIGIPIDKIELWHQDIDGKDDTFMDWEVTTDYCRKVAAAFNVPIYFSWKDGGFRREMLREDEPTAENWFEVPREEWELADNRVVLSGASKYPGYYVRSGGNGPNGTRHKFPQVSADLSVRWCSAYLKIDVCAAAIRNQRRFDNIRTVVISGERGEESSNREKYHVHEKDRADLRDGKKISRLVDRWRPIKDWTEEQVWAIIKRYKVVAHPAYYLGWSRVSCKFCIFGDKDQFASAYRLSPEQGDQIIALEKQFGCTIKRNTDLQSLIDSGRPYSMHPSLKKLATSHEYTEDIFMDVWVLPAGAYGDSCGPS